jgi:acetolactate synthase-1/2/3 large subunit
MKRLYNTISPYKGLIGGKIIYQKLLDHKVTDVFMYSGGAVMSLVDAFYKGDIKYYINSHEQNCGHAATGYARSSDKTGIVITTSGPGLTNCITPMLDAQNDSTPLIVISGQVPLKSIGTRAFQECPAIDLTKTFTKWSYLVKNVGELPDVIDEAFEIANHGKKGVVHIDVPKCILNSTYDQHFNFIKSIKSKNIMNIDQIIQVSHIINESTKPVLYIGQGCNDSYVSLRKFAKLANIPVTTTIHAVGSFDERDDLSLQFLGMHGNPAANYAIQNADCIIALGCRFDDRTTGNLNMYAPHASNIIYCNIEENELKFMDRASYTFVGDCKDFLDFITPYTLFNQRTSWFNKINEWKTLMPFEYIKDNKLRSEFVIENINNLIDTENTIITTGVGNHQMQTSQYITWASPKSFISSGSLGVMGFGLPAAIGCKIANPNKTVIDIDGDSSFIMTFSDLKTVKEHNLNIKIFIMNNHAQAMVTIWEKLFYNERYTATLQNNNPDFVTLAESFGIAAVKCTEKTNVEETIKYALKYDGPIVCVFEVDYAECLPLMAPNKALDDLILFKDYHGKLDLDENSLPPS